jgi:hypothetical protein
MTKQWYLEQGYKLSAQIEEAEIARAEADVTAAYIAPIVGTSESVPTEIRQKAVGSLAFLLLLQRSIFATRAGAKVKTGYNSQDASAWDVLQQEATACHLALETLRKQPGVNAEAEVCDICKIYFKTNFIAL